MSAVETLLRHCEKVRETGNGKFLATCPAHDDRSPSLSVRECDDGRVLVHCFAGCSTEDVLAAAGLTFADLMPERCGHRFKPRNHFNARDALEALDRQTLIVAIIAADFLRHGEIDDATFDLLLTAAAQIGAIRDEVSPRRHKP